MAGHSKWANIKHKKAAQDAKRGKLWTKLIREITVAARVGGGGDPADNPRLRAAMDKGFSANMPKDTIERAIARGSVQATAIRSRNSPARAWSRRRGDPGGGHDRQSEPHRAEVRHEYTKHGGNLGTTALRPPFYKLGMPALPGMEEDELLECALEAGPRTCDNEDGSFDVITAPENFGAVDALAAVELEPANAEVAMIGHPQRADEETSITVMKIIDQLEDLDDGKTFIPTPVSTTRPMASGARRDSHPRGRSGSASHGLWRHHGGGTTTATWPAAASALRWCPPTAGPDSRGAPGAIETHRPDEVAVGSCLSQRGIGLPGPRSGRGDAYGDGGAAPSRRCGAQGEASRDRFGPGR